MPEPQDLRFHEPFPVAVRIVVGVAGAIPFIAPYDLLIRPGIDEFHLATAPLWIISAVATAMGLAVIALAIAGLSRTVLIDPYTRTIRVDMKGSFGIAHTWRHHFDRVSSLAIRRDDDEAPVTFAIEAHLANTKQPLMITRVDNEEEANTCLARVRTAMRR